MKRIIPVVVAMVFFTAGASPKKSGWMESFDKFKDYPYSSWPSDGTKTLPAPWEGTVSMYADNGCGYHSSPGASGPAAGWSWGHAFRPTVDEPHVGDALVAKIFLPSGINYQSVLIGLTTEKTPGSSGQFAGGANAVVHIGSSEDDGFARVSFRVNDPKSKALDSVWAAPHPFLPAGAWYDVRLILGENRKVTAQYKNVEMPHWIPVGTLSVHGDFHPKYVAIATSRRGRIDDVGYSPAGKPGQPFAP